MQIILLENIRNLGGFGKVVNVTKGYARNFLVPQGKAVYATKENVSQFEARRQDYEAMAQEKLVQAQKRADVIRGLGEITLEMRAGDEGKLYGSVGTLEIAKAIMDKGVQVVRSEILLSNGAFREVGQFSVRVAVHPEVEAQLIVNIKAVKEGA